jgi:putative radical SAM enzyme (TIGR03279 family)
MPGSPADKAGYKAGTFLESLNGFPINDVLDYMFYGDDVPEAEGLLFDTFLMDEKRVCGNNCMFCFIDQLPCPPKFKALRTPLYFKDDDSRLSFLQGNYITLTNLTEHDVNRIIQMRTPVNVSVHTTNPELRTILMGNGQAGTHSLNILKRFADAGVPMNCQLVLCPGLNDGNELTRTLCDLSLMLSVDSIACVPVGLTKYRDHLPLLRQFSKEEAAAVIQIAGEFYNKTENVCCADEFYLTAELPLPDYEHYGGFPQYENGVGMWVYFAESFNNAASESVNKLCKRKTTIVTGTAAYPLLSELVKPFANVNVATIRNEFFGESVTVAGLLTGGDIITQLKERNDLGEVLLISAGTLNVDGVFLDDVTPEMVEAALGVTVCIVKPDGESLYDALTQED